MAKEKKNGTTTEMSLRQWIGEKLMDTRIVCMRGDYILEGKETLIMQHVTFFFANDF